MIDGTVIADLLELVGEPVEVPAAGRFVTRDKFVVDRDGELAISLIGEDFRDNFLDLVEEDIRPAALKQHRLLKSTVDAPIFDALGGKTEARVRLAHMFEFLKAADQKRWFFFYVVDAKGELWAADTYWRDGGWDIEVYSVTYPRGWRGGGHVVSG